jgi:hypothetical protein
LMTTSPYSAPHPGTTESDPAISVGRSLVQRSGPTVMSRSPTAPGPRCFGRHDR